MTAFTGRLDMRTARYCSWGPYTRGPQCLICKLKRAAEKRFSTSSPQINKVCSPRSRG